MAGLESEIAYLQLDTGENKKVPRIESALLKRVLPISELFEPHAKSAQKGGRISR
jgi:hypothetical protein